MAEAFWKNESLKRKTVPVFLEKAKELYPELIRKEKHPIYIRQIRQNDKNTDVLWEYGSCEAWENGSRIALHKGESVIFEFEHHMTGYLSLSIQSAGSPQDAPAFIRVKMGERLEELTENSAEHTGWLSKGWIQEEWFHLDELPEKLELKRRYAFQYVLVEVIDTSRKFHLVIDDVTCEAVSAVDMTSVLRLDSEDALLSKIDEVSIRTLQNCMQFFLRTVRSVTEDCGWGIFICRRKQITKPFVRMILSSAVCIFLRL